MDPLKKNRSRRPERRTRRLQAEEDEEYDWEEERDWEDEEEEEDDGYGYRQKLRNGRNQRGVVRHYLRKETSFFQDIAINPCRRVVRMSCNTISYIVTFFAICFFFGAVFKISYAIYSFFV